MTIEELRLRIEAAFPGCSVVRHRNMRADPLVYAELQEPMTIEGVSTQLMSFVALSDEFGLTASPNMIEDYSDRDLGPTAREIERRILGVSAHDMVAARRRLALEELATLDADLIMSEPPVEPQA